MSNEIALSMSLSGYKPTVMNAPVGLSIAGFLASMAGNYYSEGTLLVATGATLIPLGAVTQPHWCFFQNLDQTNYLSIRNGSGGADLIELYPGEPALFPMFTTAIPYAIAHTAACVLQYLIFSL